MLAALIASCAPAVAPATALALISVESSGNPFAIGVVGGQLVRQPRNASEAVATARQLLADRWNFSLGLAQINRHNLARLGLTLESAFVPCSNLRAMQAVLLECQEDSRAATEQGALREALSCYYSGDRATGERLGYVDRVRQHARRSDVPRHASFPSPTPVKGPQP